MREKREKPKPVLGKCDIPGCPQPWEIVQHHKHPHYDQKRPWRKLCEAHWKCT